MICVGDQVRMGRAALRLSEAELAGSSGLPIDTIRSAEAGGFIEDLKTAIVLTRFFELRGFECMSGPGGCGMIFRGIGKVAMTDPQTMVEALAESLASVDPEGIEHTGMYGNWPLPH